MEAGCRKGHLGAEAGALAWAEAPEDEKHARQVTGAYAFQYLAASQQQDVREAGCEVHLHLPHVNPQAQQRLEEGRVRGLGFINSFRDERLI